MNRRFDDMAREAGAILAAYPKSGSPDYRMTTGDVSIRFHYRNGGDYEVFIKKVSVLRGGFRPFQGMSPEKVLATCLRIISDPRTLAERALSKAEDRVDELHRQVEDAEAHVATVRKQLKAYLPKPLPAPK